MVDSAVLDQLKRAYGTWNDTKGEGEAARNVWLDLMADDVHLVSLQDEASALAFAKPRKSRGDVVGYFTQLLADWRMVHWTPETFVHEGDRVAMFGRCGWVNRKTDKPFETPVAHLWTFRSGKAVEIVELFDSAKVIAAAAP